jgi:hypothetical protein
MVSSRYFGIVYLTSPSIVTDSELVLVVMVHHFKALSEMFGEAVASSSEEAPIRKVTPLFNSKE